MALMGHVTPEMTLRYAKLASPTIRSAYQAAMDKVRTGQLLPLTAVNTSPPVPDKVAWLHAEMLKTRLAHGFCARPKAAGPCPYANICEQCDFFVPDPAATATMSTPPARQHECAQCCAPNLSRSREVVPGVVEFEVAVPCLMPAFGSVLGVGRDTPTKEGDRSCNTSYQTMDAAATALGAPASETVAIGEVIAGVREGCWRWLSGRCR
jgi:hypothetical protein